MNKNITIRIESCSEVYDKPVVYYTEIYGCYRGSGNNDVDKFIEHYFRQGEHKDQLTKLLRVAEVAVLKEVERAFHFAYLGPDAPAESFPPSSFDKQEEE